MQTGHPTATSASPGPEARLTPPPDLACLPDILEAFADLTEELGLVSERKAAKLLYLALTSRLLNEPVPICIQGRTCMGKTALLRTVLPCFPDEAYHEFVRLSVLRGGDRTTYRGPTLGTRYLPAVEGGMGHRVLVIEDVHSVGRIFPAPLLLSLLQRHQITCQPLERHARMVVLEGPTGLVVTTTHKCLPLLLDTRMVPIRMRGGTAQTAAVIDLQIRMANEPESFAAPDLTPWHELQRWLARGTSRVLIPYVHWVTENIAPHWARNVTDFLSFMTLVRSHALLHQASRSRTEHGAIVATARDYAAVYALAGPAIAEAGRELVRETVAVVAELIEDTGRPVSRRQVAEALNLDPAVAEHRLRVNTKRGYLVERGSGSARRWRLGEPLPQPRSPLPDPATMPDMTHTAQ